MDTFEIIHSVEWYVNLKNLSLKNALAIRCPMDLETQQEHRLYYSQYLASVLSITELLLDKATPNREEFKFELFKALSSNQEDGTKYYDYLRELRNSVVHRGCNITASAHIVKGFPSILSPTPVENRSGNQAYDAPEKYLLDIIRHLETVLPKLIVQHIENYSWAVVNIEASELRTKAEQFIINSEAMPDWVKNQSLNAVKDIDLVSVRKVQIESALKTIGVELTIPNFA